MPRTILRSCRLAAPFLVALALLAHPGVATAQELPPPIGSEAPRVEPLREDFNDAKAEGKRFAVVFEQRGCPYCIKLHNEILALKYINDYVRENFRIVQLDLWGAREVTDFDGSKMPEKALAERWGVIFTPTIVFFKDDLTGLDGKWGRPLEAIERLPLSYGQHTFYDLFVWVRHKLYEKDRNFQRFHISRIAEREALQAVEPRKGN